MKIHEKKEFLILEKENPKLRSIIGEIVTDIDYNLSEIFTWYEEDNSGDIQINCSIWAQGVLEEFIDVEKKNENYDIEELNILTELLEVMIKIQDSKEEYKFITFS